MNQDQNTALQKIIDHAKAGKLGAKHQFAENGCVYHSRDGRFCVIGCLLSPRTHELLDILSLNEDTTVEHFYDLCDEENADVRELGERFLAEVPFTSQQAGALQSWHDHAYLVHQDAPAYAITPDDLIEMLESVLSGETLEINSRIYRVETYPDNDMHIRRVAF